VGGTVKLRTNAIHHQGTKTRRKKERIHHKNTKKAQGGRAPTEEFEPLVSWMAGDEDKGGSFARIRMWDVRNGAGESVRGPG
jgi:hypothetical protein